MQRNEVHTEVISRTECDICHNDVNPWRRMNRRVLFSGAEFCVSVIPMSGIKDLCDDCIDKIMKSASTGEMQF